MKRTYVSIDGAYLNYIMRDIGFSVNADNIEKIAHACIDREHEELWRVLFYHCREYEGETMLPISGDSQQWRPRAYQVVDDLARRDYFSVRLGNLAFRGWRKKPGRRAEVLSDSDFSPVFEQKGVDMRIGLDMSVIAHERLVDRMILVSADTDLIPALSLCRQRGIQTVMVNFPDKNLSPRLQEHTDIFRYVEWPEDLELFKPRTGHHEHSEH